MSQYFTYPVPVVQSIGLVSVPTSDREDASWVERKPVAAAVLTLSQRDDGHVILFHELMTAVDEQQFPLTWLVEQELVAGAPTLVGVGDATLLTVDAAQQRHFVERKLVDLRDAHTSVHVAGLAGDGIGEPALCRRLDVPRLDITPEEVARVWTWYPRESRVATLGQHALANAVSRLMVWANLQATLTREPGWFYETMIALRCWMEEREHDAPEIYKWGTCKPIMRAVSFVEDYRRDLSRRLAGEPSDWPTFEPGLFHT